MGELTGAFPRHSFAGVPNMKEEYKGKKGNN
jgi:hypothetical protein